MQILSVNVGRPRLIEWGERRISTSIFKQAVTGPVALTLLNFAGDKQADPTVHGGPDKAVYAYDAAHYAYWRPQLPAWADWAPGLFGENLTTEGLLEADVRVGDLFGLGGAQLRAVQPRQPCYKLNARFVDPGMVRRFSLAERPGIYFRVEAPGSVQAGDALNLLEAAATDVTILDLSRLLLTRESDPDQLAQVLALPHLPASLRQYLGS
jgi:MOSC domain-containing protein YiiM